MRYISGDTANHDHEVDEAAWFEVKAAKKALKYVNEKRLLDLGLEYLSNLEGDPYELRPSEEPAVAAEAALVESGMRESATR
jgi:hypothetical protein